MVCMKTTTKAETKKAQRAAAKAAREATRAADLKALSLLCNRLYDSATPASERADLSLEVAFLRAKVAGCSDLLGSMTSASVNEEEC
jgi:hypothetical protein